MGREKHQAYRRAIYERELDAPQVVFSGKGAEELEVLAFGRNFSPSGDADKGYVLLTNGMSDRRMTMPANAQGRAPRAELMWYVREPKTEIVNNLRWLANFPFIDDTWLGFGHRIPLPSPLLHGSDFRTYLLLTPVIKPDQRIAQSLMIDSDFVEILTVHLIPDAEYAFIKADGLDPFLDVLDEHGYPTILNLNRKSYK